MFTTIAASLLLSTLAAATPVSRRDTCTPNFQGAGLAVVNDAGEWTPSSLLAGSDIHTTQVGTFAPGFRIEQDGQWPTGYLIKALNVPANDLVASSTTGSLTLQTIANDRTQDFIIACDSCGSTSSGCTLQSAASGQCVQSSKESGVLFFEPCDGSDGQKFTIDTTSPA